MNLSNLTSKNLITLDLEAKTKVEVIEKLVEKLDQQGVLESKEAFLKAVLDREKLSPTGLEEGLAIPHGKSTAVKKATFAIARLKTPIEDWESIDEDNEVTLVFLLAIPKSEEEDTHIEVLTKLTSLFIQDGFIKKLQRAKTKDEIISLLGQPNSEKSEEVKNENSPQKINIKSKKIGFNFNKIKQHLLYGTSHMIPFIVAGGVLLSLAVMISGQGAVPEHGILKDISDMGIAGLTLFTAVLGGYIAYSIADKPGLAPGMIGSWIAVQQYKTGFLGAIIVGFIAGFIVLQLKKIKLPDSMGSLGSIFIYPLIGTFLTCGVVMWVIGAPISSMMNSMNHWLAGMAGSGKIMLGAILGGMTAFDMGGPVNKVATLFAQTQVDTQPWLMGGVGVAICVPPLGMFLATLFAPKKYSSEEREAGKAAGIMGLIGITEGAIPFAAADPIRVIPSIVVGGIIGNIIAFMMNVINHAPWGGWIVLPVIDGRLGYVIATIIGALSTALLVNFLKKEKLEDDIEEEEEFIIETVTGEGEARILAVTACPSGVAHTFLSAKALEKAGAKLRVPIKVETQGANGLVNRLTAKDIENADFIILTTDVAIKDNQRFKNSRIIRVSTKDVIKNSIKIISDNL